MSYCPFYHVLLYFVVFHHVAMAPAKTPPYTGSCFAGAVAAKQVDSSGSNTNKPGLVVPYRVLTVRYHVSMYLKMSRCTLSCRTICLPGLALS